MGENWLLSLTQFTKLIMDRPIVVHETICLKNLVIIGSNNDSDTLLKNGF